MLLPAISMLAALAAEPPVATGPASQVSQERLMAVLRALPAKRAATGDDESRNNLIALQTTLASQCLEMGYWPTAAPVRWKRRGEVDSLDWRNIAFEIPGRTRPDEVLVVGAHFDAVPTTPGADDNGSGTAALLEIARVLRARPMHRTVRFVLFNLEELGHTGSNQYAAQCRDDHKAGTPRLVGMLSLETIGYYSDAPGSQRSPFKGIKGVPEPDKGDFIAMTTIAAYSPFARALDAAARAGEPGLKTQVIDMFPIAPPDLLRSDHTPFLLMGVPAVMITDTADFRNPNYHKPGDTFETINAEAFTRSVRGLAAAVHALAGPLEAGPPPDWSAPKQTPIPTPAEPDGKTPSQ